MAQARVGAVDDGFSSGKAGHAAARARRAALATGRVDRRTDAPASVEAPAPSQATVIVATDPRCRRAFVGNGSGPTGAVRTFVTIRGAGGAPFGRPVTKVGDSRAAEAAHQDGGQASPAPQAAPAPIQAAVFRGRPVTARGSGRPSGSGYSVIQGVAGPGQRGALPGR